MKKYYPEGARPDIEAVEKRLSSPAELKNAFLSGESLEARAVLCAPACPETADTISTWI